MPKSGAPAARTEIDFQALARELLSMASRLVPDWLPGGTHAENDEYKAAPTSKGGPGDSWVVNLRKGKWAHFGSDDRGNDLVGLYAALFHACDQVAAGRALIENLHLQHCLKPRAGPPPAPRERSPVPPAGDSPAAAPDAAPKPHKAEKGEFVPLLPIPEHAGEPLAAHPFRGKPAHVWAYRRDGQRLGYVYRFVTSDGGKEVLPLVWGQSLANSQQKWVWKHWSHPKPLYLPGGTLRADVPVVIVEGEKCADALHALVGDEFDVLSWPGGTKSADKADWAWLLPAEGGAAPRRKVILWPDADYKRRQLTPSERAAGVAADSVDYLPARKQPGLVAMEKIAAILFAQQEPEIWLWRPPASPALASEAPPLSDGWDCADAIAQGWDADRVRAFLRAAPRWEPVARQGVDGPGSAGASGRSAGAAPDADDDPKAWRMGLLRNDEGAPRAVRENVVLALQSLPEVRGLIAFNEFSNDIIKLAAMPWGSPAGKWSEVDELLMGEWLVRSVFLPSMPRTTLEEGMRMVATRHQYHPVRQYLQGLRWDGQPRLNDWLMRAVVDAPDKLGRRTRKYLQRVGAWFLMGMVSRALRPGCKFDYMPILEGAQGMRKSSLLNVLAGDWFADTGFVLGDKDSLQMLQGRWLYEISELDAMARAEVTKIKAFVASRMDWYRASFDKRPREYPRQLVFAGTTNEHQYLVDPTGNRRFWPISVTRVIDTDWVSSVRDQLFAEALVRVQQGERFHPNQREELELFIPQQNARLVESPIEVRLLDYLVNHAEGQLATEVQIVFLLGAIGIDITKLGPGRFHEKQAGAALRKFGWERKRAPAKPGSKYRPWAYVRPDGWPACLNLDELDEPDARDDAPAQRSPGAQAPGQKPAAAAAEPADYDDSMAIPPGDASAAHESDGNDPF